MAGSLSSIICAITFDVTKSNTNKLTYLMADSSFIA